jgi:hypothetical protein
MIVDEMSGPIEPLVLKNTPDVLSVGYRCMRLGFSFIWPPGQNPYFITPDNLVIELEVIRNIPYIRSGSRLCAPRRPGGKRSFPCAPADGDAEPPGEADPPQPEAQPSGINAAEHAEGEGDVAIPKRDLRLEAESMAHKLTHKPKNPYCKICDQAKTKEKSRIRGSFKRELSAWGDVITADHLDSKRASMMGLSGEKEALVIKDVWSKLKHIVPVATKNAEDTEMAIREFVGDRPVKLFYSDASGEIKKACKLLRLVHERSQPGVPQNNAIIERTNQDIVTGTIASLVQAGLPPCFWSFAASCYCMLDNTDYAKGPSPWALTHGEEFGGLRVPFGTKVTFRPSPTKRTQPGKWDPPTSTGVFAGYVLKPGYNWRSTSYGTWRTLRLSVSTSQ